MSKLEVDAIEPQSGTTITIGSSGDTVNLVGTLQSNGSPLPGDISEVIAGTGLSGGGTTGAVTINIDSAQPTITSLGTITGFTSTGIDDNATSTAITIDSSENVDIVGTTTSSNFISDGTGYGIKFLLNGTATLNTSSNSAREVVFFDDDYPLGMAFVMAPDGILVLESFGAAEAKGVLPGDLLSQVNGWPLEDDIDDEVG